MPPCVIICLGGSVRNSQLSAGQALYVMSAIIASSAPISIIAAARIRVKPDNSAMYLLKVDFIS